MPDPALPSPMIRRAEVIADAAACAAIYGWYVTHTVASLEDQAPTTEEMGARMAASLRTHEWLVAEDAGEVVAYAYAAPHRSRPGYRYTAEVSVYVAPGHERRGLGRALYVPLLDRLERRGHRLALAGVTLPNDASAGLHESLGFARVATYPRVGWKHGAWHDTGWWALALGGDGPPVPLSPPCPA